MEPIGNSRFLNLKAKCKTHGEILDQVEEKAFETNVPIIVSKHDTAKCPIPTCAAVSPVHVFWSKEIGNPKPMRVDGECPIHGWFTGPPLVSG